MESSDNSSGGNSEDVSSTEKPLNELSSAAKKTQNDRKIKLDKDIASPGQSDKEEDSMSGRSSPENKVISTKVDHNKVSSNDKVTPWKLVNGSNEDSTGSSSETSTKNCDSHNSVEHHDANESTTDSTSGKVNENNSDSVQKTVAVSDVVIKNDKDSKCEEETEEHVEMEVEVSDGEQDMSTKSDTQGTPVDSDPAPIETRRRSLRNASRRTSDTSGTAESPGKSVSSSQRGRCRSPRGSPNKAELKVLKDSKVDNKNNYQTAPLELTVSKVEPVVPPVAEFEGTDEEILKEAKFPDFLMGIFDLGNFVPLKDINNSQLNLKDGESLLDAPSLLVPLLVKKPDRLNKESLEDAGKDEKTVKKNAWETKAYFTSSVGEFLVGIGLSRVTEWYEKDLIKAKNRQQKREGKSEDLDEEIQKHKKAWGQSRIANEPFTFGLKRCKNCDFKTESQLVLEGHYLTPHMSSRREFKCNFCTYITRDPKAILFHMIAAHGKKGRLDPSNQCFYDCPFCTFETNLKTKATSHINKCQKYFLPSRNQYPPSDWEYPAVTVKPITMNDIKSYEMCIAAASAVARSNPALAGSMGKVGRPVGRPPGVGGSPKMIRPATPYRTMSNPQGSVSLYQQIVTTSSYKDGRLPQLSSALLQKSRFPGLGKLHSKPEITVAVPGGQIYQVVNNNGQMVPVMNTGGLHSSPGSQFLMPTNSASGHSPVALFSGNSKNSISLIPHSGANTGIKRGSQATSMSNMRGSYHSSTSSSVPPKLQGPYGSPNQAAKAPNSTHPLLGNTTFVICEICDGYLKDLEQLRTHMLWIHKVKIHPKMLASRPPLNCQKCQWRFFTDQGLERHLLGAHGLVTSNMQELANKGQDGGRCTVCGRVYVCKLVSHMNQVHKVTLKPAHLSYKCTVCSATFNLYKLFENHVYMFHSGSVKRASSGSDEGSVAKKKVPPPAVVQAAPAAPPEKQVIEITTAKPVSSTVEKADKKEDELDVKINDEKTDLQPEAVVLESSDTKAKETAPVGAVKKNADFPADGKVECEWCGVRVRKLHMHMRVRHTRKCRVKLCHIEKCEKCLCSFDGMVVLHTADFEDSDDGTSANTDKVISID